MTWESRGDKGLQVVTGGYKGLTRGERGLQGVTRGYKELQEVTGADKGLKGL